jgi:hypothetical protein
MGGVRQRQRQSRPVARLSFRAVASGADLYAADAIHHARRRREAFRELVPLKSPQDSRTCYCLQNLANIKLLL